MKTCKISLLSALLALSLGCKNDPGKTSVEQQEQGTLPQMENDTIPPGTDETQTSTGWEGSYSGSLPCGDCKGILTKITISKDKAYTLSSVYMGKETKPTIYKGTYTLDDKNIITLDAEGDHLKFLVMEQDSMLKKLDKFGNEEQGGPAARYFLHKVK